jgi:hypothetical protein
VEVVADAALALDVAEGVALVAWAGPMPLVPVAIAFAQAAGTARHTSRACHATNNGARNVAPSWPASADRRMRVPESVGKGPADRGTRYRQLETE